MQYEGRTGSVLRMEPDGEAVVELDYQITEEMLQNLQYNQDEETGEWREDRMSMKDANTLLDEILASI